MSRKTTSGMSRTLDAQRAAEVDENPEGRFIARGAPQHLASRYLETDYRVDEDGGVIARLMRRQDITEGLGTLLFAFSSD